MNASRHNRRNLRSILLGATAATLAASSAGALTGHFSGYQDPNYNFEIYAGPIGNEGCGAWTMSGHLLTRGNGYINEFNPTQNGVHQGTNVHNVITTHNVPGLDSGAGITNAADGYLYTVGFSGVMRVNPNNWAAPAVLMPGSVPTSGYSINALPNGKIVYSDSGTNSKVYLYDPTTFTNTLIYTAPTLVDDIETGPGGEIALAGYGNSSIILINSSGGLINQFPVSRNPDGLAFGDGPFGNSVYANNNDGSITRYDLGAGYSGTPTVVDIALTLPGNHGYGDLATVGPDCAFYIGTFQNGSINGATPGVGTNWDNGTTNGENSIVRIGFNDRNGLPNSECAFYSLVETFVPEPASMSMAVLGVGALLRRNRRV